jgi:hypothetical protein
MPRPMRRCNAVEHTWMHPLTETLGALLRAGLRLESFAEYPYSAWAIFPWMGGARRWGLAAPRRRAPRCR